MNTNTTNTAGGMGFLGWLTLIFIVLKLTGYIAWSWLWVLSPLWIPFAFVISFFLIVGIIAAFQVK